MTELNIQIEELIENNAEDFKIAKVIKNEIKSYLDSLNDIFDQSSGKDFFVKHTKKIDDFIKVIYKYLLRKHFGSYMPMSSNIPITIIALGSYGREQLCIYSDIDIMLLYEETSGYNLKPIMEEFMTLSWDSGLKLGSRAHDVKEVLDAVNEDITIKTSFLESRMIYGSKHLWFKYQNSLIKIRNYEKKEFVLEKLQEHDTRLTKNPLDMQPNIKDGYGGMRESNMLFWILNITYGVSSTRQMSDKLFCDEEYKKYRIALEYVFQVRNALHLCAKKKLDVVTFDILPEISSKLGFKDTVRLTKERQCMEKLFKSLHTIHGFTSLITKKVIRRYLFEPINIQNMYQRRIKKDLYLCGDTLYSSFHRKSVTLNTFLKELIELPNYINSFDVSYVLFAYRTTMPNKLGVTTKSLIKSLLQQTNLYPVIELLYKSGLLVELIPIFGKIINQPQFDGYHKHPVDVHSIRTLYHIQNIKDPFVNKMYEKQNDRQKFMINLVALFHDVGKGRGKDHHVVGQHLFKRFAKSLELGEVESTKIATLIRYHNMMTKVATTEDIYSQNIILAFTGIITSKELLEMLFIITYADINSVDSKLYKSSTSALLKELYLQTIPAYDNEELLKVSTRRAHKENAIKNHKLFNTIPFSKQKKILKIESNQMFLKYKAENIIKIALKALDVKNYYFDISNKEHLKIKIIREVPLNLGFLLGKLHFLNISSMGIYKLFDNKKFFEISFDENLDQEEISLITEIVEESFDMSKDIKLKKPIINKEDIEVDCDHTDDLAKLNIVAKDQKGLFSYIAKIFDQFDIEIHSAKIQSNKGKVNDMLLISKNGNFCSNKDQIIEALTQAY